MDMGCQNGKQISQKSQKQVETDNNQMEGTTQTKYLGETSKNNNEQYYSKKTLKQVNDENNQSFSKIKSDKALPQNIDDILIDFTQIKCENHKDEQVRVVNMNINASQRLCCVQCMFQNKYQLKDFIQIEEFYKNLQNNVYKKVINTNPENIQFIDEQLKIENDFIFIGFAKESFQNYKKAILQNLDACEKVLESNISKIQNACEKMRSDYSSETLDQQEKIKQKILSNDLTKSELEDQINQIINNHTTETKNFECLISENIKKYHDGCQSIFSNLLQLSSNISTCALNQITHQKTYNLINKFPNVNFINYQFGNFTCKRSGLEIKLNDQKQLEIQKDQNGVESHYIFNQNLNPHIKYELSLETLGKDENFNMQFGFQEYRYFEFIYIPIHGQNKQKMLTPSVTQGQDISTLKKQNKQIKVQICLQDRIFQWKYENNVNKSNQISEIDSSNYYQFAVKISNPFDKLIIKECKVVERFESW